MSKTDFDPRIVVHVQCHYEMQETERCSEPCVYENRTGVRICDAASTRFFTGPRDDTLVVGLQVCWIYRYKRATCVYGPSRTIGGWRAYPIAEIDRLRGDPKVPGGNRTP
jgi:hypothetical protein